LIQVSENRNTWMNMRLFFIVSSWVHAPFYLSDGVFWTGPAG